VIGADQILVGRNATRRAYNTRMRERRGFAGELPATGDKLVCLRNNKRKGLFNGALWSVKEKPSTRRDIIKMRLQPDDGFAGKGIKVSVRPECFRRHRRRRMAAAQAFRRVRLWLCAHRPQGARLAVGRRGAVRRVRGFWR
jgi:hypothetical protein